MLNERGNIDRILILIMGFLAIVFGVGWFKEVYLGHKSTGQYIQQFWYFVTHVHQLEFFRRLTDIIRTMLY